MTPTFHLSSTDAIPWSVHAAVALTLLVGLIIWVAGGRLMRPAFIALGALIGAALAHLLPDALRQWIGEWAVAAAGAIAGMLVGWLAFRVLVANTLAMVVALAGTLAVAGFASVETDRTAPESLQPANIAATDADDPQDLSLDEWIRSMRQRALRHEVDHAFDEARGHIRAAAQPEPTLPADTALERGTRALRIFAARLWEQTAAFWNEDLSPRGRALLLVTYVLGYLGGLVLGFAMPKRAAAVTTAMIGPAVWLPAAAYVTVALGMPIAQRAPSEPLAWLAAWGALAAIGLIIQLLGSRKPAAPAPAQ